ncbi:MAG: hypothetical protein M0R46_03870 [Candidatus Muirbacterium halophilum]|nr:hypothetical protein [Candidatus Muirbacterium halophilum]MCK9475029.1 hypothetical protein [Candidatus Muirbacterium halophilum]
MAHAYTPGLKVTPNTVVIKERRLPLKGNILVKKGDKVKSEDIVAKTELPGNVVPLNVVNILSIAPEELHELMLKKEGESVEKGEMIAQSRGLFGWFKTPVLAPASGVIESVSNITGQVIIRLKPIPVELNAYIDGIVEEVLSGEGVIITSNAMFIQGIFGIGGETEGKLVIAVKDIKDKLEASNIDETMKGKIIVGGSKVTTDALNKAIKVGVKGIISGGVDADDLKNFLGYDIGVAITGHEEKGITLVTTEGFGEIAMAQKTFDLLKKNQGKKASINGTTQIRAGVMRPEIIVTNSNIDSIPKEEKTVCSEEEFIGMCVGDNVRLIRDPHFGEIVKVKSLPVELSIVESETKVRVVEIELEDGKTLIVPRANVETIEK